MGDVRVLVTNFGKADDVLVHCGVAGISIRGYLTKEGAAKLRDELDELLRKRANTEG